MAPPQTISSFADLLRPIGQDEFLAEHWEKRPLHIARGDAIYYQRMLTKEAVDTLIATGGLRFPALQLARGGGFYPPEAFTRDVRAGANNFTGVPDLDRIRAEYQAGATIVLPGLQRGWGPLGTLTSAIEAEFCHPVHANGYVAPGGAPGFLPHYDTHELFALQIAGRKHWRIEPPTRALPHHRQLFSPAAYRPAPRCLEVELVAGDLLYLPRGFIHSTETMDSFSVHVALGIAVYTWADLVAAWLPAADAPAILRQALPRGFARDPTLATQLVTRLSRALPASPSPPELRSSVERFCAGVRSASRPAITSFDCDVRVIGLETVLQAPDPSQFAVVEEDSKLVLTFARRRYRFASETWPLFEAMCGPGRFSVSALPSNTDREAALTLARTLAGIGFLGCPV